MQRYVVVENLRRLRALLETEGAPEKRRLLEELIREEKAKLERIDAPPTTDHGTV